MDQLPEERSLVVKGLLWLEAEQREPSGAGSYLPASSPRGTANRASTSCPGPLEVPTLGATGAQTSASVSRCSSS